MCSALFFGYNNDFIFSILGWSIFIRNSREWIWYCYVGQKSFHPQFSKGRDHKTMLDNHESRAAFQLVNTFFSLSMWVDYFKQPIIENTFHIITLLPFSGLGRIMEELKTNQKNFHFLKRMKYSKMEAILWISFIYI